MTTVYVVNQRIDTGTAADGTTGGVGTLSWAVAQVNANPGAHQVIDIRTNVSLSGPLSPIFNSVTIRGHGHTIDAQGITRIFMVGVDDATKNDPRFAGSIIAHSQHVAINDLTLANGLAHGGSGTGGGMGAGGALFVNQSANVTLTDVVFRNDQAIGGAGDSNRGGGGGLGGNGGTSTIGGGGGIFGNGGDGFGAGGGGLFGDGGNGAGFGVGGGGGGYSGDGGNAPGAAGAAGILSIAGLSGGGGTGQGVNSGQGGTNGGGGGAGGSPGGGGGGGFGGSDGSTTGNAGFGGGGGTHGIFGGLGGFGGGGGSDLGDGGFGAGGGGEGNSGYGGGGAFKGNGGFGGGGGQGGGLPGFGGGSGDDGGGAGMGGAIFVVKGGHLTINGNGTEASGSVTGGVAGGGFGMAGSAFGSGIFVQGSAITFGGSGTYRISDDITDQNGAGGAAASDGLGGTGGVTSLTKNGTGTLILAGTDTYSGETTVNRGTLQVDGTIVSSTAVKPGATLAGHGTTGDITVLRGGTLSPGGHRAAILDTGNVVLRANAHFAIQLGAHHSDQLDVTGHVHLGGAILDLSLLAGFHPATGRTFEIVANDGSDPVHGRFAGLVQGAHFAAGGEEFSINYHGGDGNDVMLTALGSAVGWGGPGMTPDHLATLSPQLHGTHHDFLFV